MRVSKFYVMSEAEFKQKIKEELDRLISNSGPARERIIEGGDARPWQYLLDGRYKEMPVLNLIQFDKANDSLAMVWDDINANYGEECDGIMIYDNEGEFHLWGMFEDTKGDMAKMYEEKKEVERKEL